MTTPPLSPAPIPDAVVALQERIVAFMARDYEPENVVALLHNLDDQGKLALYLARAFHEGLIR